MRPDLNIVKELHPGVFSAIMWLPTSRIRGPERYRLLGECGWHVLMDTPANDFGQVCSPDREVVVKAVQLHLASPVWPWPVG